MTEQFFWKQIGCPLTYKNKKQNCVFKETVAKNWQDNSHYFTSRFRKMHVEAA